MISIGGSESAKSNKKPFSCMSRHIFCVNNIEVTLELATMKLKILIIQWKVVLTSLHYDGDNWGKDWLLWGPD